MQRGEQPMATHQAPGSSSAWAQKYSVEATPLGRGSFATVSVEAIARVLFSCVLVSGCGMPAYCSRTMLYLCLNFCPSEPLFPGFLVAATFSSIQGSTKHRYLAHTHPCCKLEVKNLPVTSGPSRWRRYPLVCVRAIEYHGRDSIARCL